MKTRKICYILCMILVIFLLMQFTAKEAYSATWKYCGGDPGESIVITITGGKGATSYTVDGYFESHVGKLPIRGSYYPKTKRIKANVFEKDGRTIRSKFDGYYRKENGGFYCDLGNFFEISDNYSIMIYPNGEKPVSSPSPSQPASSELTGNWKVTIKTSNNYYIYLWEIGPLTSGRNLSVISTLLDTDHEYHKNNAIGEVTTISLTDEGQGKFRYLREATDKNPGNEGYFKEEGSGTYDSTSIRGTFKHAGSGSSIDVTFEGQRQ